MKYIRILAVCGLFFLLVQDREVEIELMSQDAPRRSEVQNIVCGGQTGSAFYIDETTIVTANHVAENNTCVDRGSTNNRSREIEVIARDSTGDVAVLRGPRVSRDRAYTINCDGFIPGERYYGAGYVQDGSQYRSVPMTARNEAYRVDLDGQTTLGSLDGSVQQGMSGGPIVNDRGEVVGIITAQPRDNTNITLSQEMRDTRFCN